MKTREWAGLALTGLSALAMMAAIYAALVYAPTERVMGALQRIFYFHVPVAVVAFLSFGVSFVASIGYLARGGRRWDQVAYAAAEIGEVFASLVILTGMMWARAAWNTWWTWDPRLTTTLVLWLIYAGYLILRGSVEDEIRRARYSAVVAILGFLDVPVVFMAIRWWRTIHPVVFDSSGVNLEPAMLSAFLISLAAFVILYVALLLARVRQESLADEVEFLRRRVQ
ncbi:MAG TPA: cytochrome c biogenesis protein CcsA [Anaerolineae bacterium]|nr:cytochrome c biogenesis protein CcsA [Anaerolineae bacterium]HOR00623.1 cytochrome c biogenesis protein CcsA [Anaerolineae bacterium]HPL28832.1 cytochrome c biogenesis protein CcsA [Anaerolineae bacterium]